MLVLIPDHTRTIPLPQLFRMLVDILSDASKLDFMVALGTHPPLDEDSLNKLVGITQRGTADPLRLGRAVAIIAGISRTRWCRSAS